MTTTPFFQVDAFVTGPLTGNPAAVMPLDQWLDDHLMQRIAAENNLSETAFFVPSDGDDADFELRWFTPTVEVDLCGHATLASGHIAIERDLVRFSTRSGILSVERRDGRLWLDLPAASVEPGEDAGLFAALGVPDDTSLFLGHGGNGAAIALVRDEASVRAVDPDFRALKAFDRLVIVTAPGDEQDIVSRVFAAAFGIDEDPVTGSAHGSLVPLWAQRLGRNRFDAYQASRRGGRLECELRGDRVLLGGRCNTVIAGHFQL